MKLSAQEKEALGKRASFEIDASNEAKGSLPERWRANEDCYACAQTGTGVMVIPGNQGDDIPIWQPKADRIVSTVLDQFTALFPMVQCIDESAQGKNLEAIELALQTLADRGHFADRELSPTLYDSLNTNAGCIRVAPKLDDDGKVVGIEFRSIHPNYLMGYPHEVGSFDECTSVGHRFDKRVWEVKELIADGVYDDPRQEIVGNAAPMGDIPYGGTGGNTRSSDGDGERLTRITTAFDQDDETVELWEMIMKAKLGKDKKRRWYKVILWKDVEVVMSCEPYGALLPVKTEIVEEPDEQEGDAEDEAPTEGEAEPINEEDDEPELDFKEYPEPWYVDFRTQRSRYTIWPAWSPANYMQTIQNTIMQMVESLIQGFAFSAFPSGFLVGGGLPPKSFTLKPGDWPVLTGDVKVVQVPNQFNPGLAGEIIQLFQEFGDASSGISRLGTSQSLPASESATAAAGFLQAQNEAKGAYADEIAPSIERVWRIMFWILQFHAEDILEENKGRFPKELTVKTIRDSAIRFEVTGTDPAANPNTLIQKIQLVMQITQGDQNFDRSKLIQLILGYLDFPFDTASLLAPPVQLHPQAIALLRGLGFTDDEISTQLGHALLLMQMKQAGQLGAPPNGQNPPNDQPPGAGPAVPSQPPGPGVPPGQPGMAISPTPPGGAPGVETAGVGNQLAQQPT